MKCFPPRQVQQTALASVCVCVCMYTCVVKACCLLQRKRSFFFISTQERSCALRGAGERTWARAAYLCFYELLKIRLAWSNLPRLRPLSPQMQEMEREEGEIEKPPVQNMWSMAGSSTLPFTACLYQFRAQWAITPQLHLHPPLSHTERHSLWRSKSWSCLLHTPLLEKAIATASACSCFTACIHKATRAAVL